MPPKMLPTADTVYRYGSNVLQLRPSRYRAAVATRDDDGIVDDVAVERFARGDVSVALSPREVVCVVARLAAEGMSDASIAGRFGRWDDGGNAWALKVRERNGIESHVREARPGTRGIREADRRPRRLTSGERRFPRSGALELVSIDPGITSGSRDGKLPSLVRWTA